MTRSYENIDPTRGGADAEATGGAVRGGASCSNDGPSAHEPDQGVSHSRTSSGRIRLTQMATVWTGDPALDDLAHRVALDHLQRTS